MTADLDRPLWERRFRAPTVTLPEYSPASPDRLVFASTESGVWQVWCWDRSSGIRRRVTDHPVGVLEGVASLDGERVIWWQEETGDESGRWLTQPFAGGPTEPFLEDVPAGWVAGLAQAPGIVVAGVADRDGFAVYASVEGGPAKELVRSPEMLHLGGTNSTLGRGSLSADGTLLVLEHGEDGDMIHPALRVVDPRTAEVIGDLRDPGKALEVAAWSPVPGDRRVAFVHELDGEERPGIWNLETGERTNLDIGVTGMIVAADWYPDGAALLISRLHEGRHTLHRFEPATGSLMDVPVPPGDIWSARVRPDGHVWFRLSSGDEAPRVLDDTGDVMLAPEGERAPAGRPYTSWHFENEHGQDVHGFFVAPPGDGPFPVIMLVHGGPTSLDTDGWDPEAQSYVDMGFAVAMVNYRGSIGYGAEWRDTLIRNIGGPELEDVNAGLRDLVARGIVDPRRAVIGGWSWGGYVTLMELGTHPELWIAGIAGVPVGDYELSYDDMSPELQAYDRALLGGEPKDVPELMADRNPIHHADAIRAPLIYVIGENDSRCPYRQAMAHVEKVAARDHPHEVYVFGTGHGSHDMDEEVRYMRAVHAFLAKHVPGVAIPA